MWCADCACERQEGHDHETNDGKGWRFAHQLCWFCGHDQVAVFRADVWVDQHECGECGLMTAVEMDNSDYDNTVEAS